MLPAVDGGELAPVPVVHRDEGVALQLRVCTNMHIVLWGGVRCQHWHHHDRTRSVAWMHRTAEDTLQRRHAPMDSMTVCASSISTRQPCMAAAPNLSPCASVSRLSLLVTEV